MKTAVSISVKKPCRQKFETFSKIPGGGYCSSCAKEVIDFTQMSETELISYFSSPSLTTCGRFKSSQLGTYEQKTTIHMNTNFASKGIAVFSFSLLALCATAELNAQTSTEPHPLPKTELSTVMGRIAVSAPAQQTHTVKGTVLDEGNLPLAGVNVVLKGTTVGTVSDFDGAFEFPQQLETGNMLVFSYLGYETKYYEVPASNEQILDISIQFDNADVELMGEVVIDGVYSSKRSFFQKVADMFR